MREYSDLFQTLHDQPSPVGNLVGGTHYTVLRAPCWQEFDLTPRDRAQFLDFVILWDEDHDERIVPVVEDLYLQGLLPPIAFVGERKGGLSVLLHSTASEKLQEQDKMDDYLQRLEKAIDPPGDHWPLMAVGVFGGEKGAIGDEPDWENLYLRSIDLLWDLGLKEAQRGLRFEEQGIKHPEGAQ